MQCRGGSTLELTLKSEQLILHTAWARAIEAMVGQFLRELKKASVGCLLLPGAPGLSLRFLVLVGYWVGGHTGR